MSEHVVLVNERDEEIGIGEKWQVHVEGRLHRAFSVFVFDTAGRLLLQRRSPDKYHSGGLWSNTCCSHPRPDEPVAEAARRRLQEEMGFTCEVEHLFGFVYKTRLKTPRATLFEHEYDHVFAGRFDGTPAPDAREVAEWRWVDPGQLRREMRAAPEHYTFWFKISLDRVLGELNDHRQRRWILLLGRP